MVAQINQPEEAVTPEPRSLKTAENIITELLQVYTANQLIAIIQTYERRKIRAAMRAEIRDAAQAAEPLDPERPEAKMIIIKSSVLTSNEREQILAALLLDKVRDDIRKEVPDIIRNRKFSFYTHRKRCKDKYCNLGCRQNLYGHTVKYVRFSLNSKQREIFVPENFQLK